MFLALASILVAMAVLPVGAFCLLMGKPPRGYGFLRGLAPTAAALRGLGLTLVAVAVIVVAVALRSIRLL